MSAENDLALAYHMGYDDALAKRKPDASKAQVLAPYDLAAENAKLREQGARLFDKTLELGTENAKLREERDMYRDLVGMMDHPDLNAQLQAENAKLRELAVRAYETARMMCEAWDGPCQSNSDVPSWRVPCPTDERDEQCVFGQLERDMRELGMEEDE